MLAIASSVGILSACGIPFNEVVASMPFLVIGELCNQIFYESFLSCTKLILDPKEIHIQYNKEAEKVSDL